MFGIGWDVLQPKGNIIAPIVFIPAKKTPKMRGSFAMKPSQRSMLKAIHDPVLCIKSLVFSNAGHTSLAGNVT